MERKGIGLKLTNGRGGTRVYSDSLKLENDIKMMLMTPRGSMIGNPTYGSDIYRYLFMENTVMVLEMISTEVMDLLQTFDGVEVKEVYSTLEYDQVYIHYECTYDNNLLTNTVHLLIGEESSITQEELYI